MEFYKIDPVMPPLASGHYLIEYLFELGPSNGDKPLDGPDLVAWQQLLGIEWKPYEARLLLQLSRAYLGETHRATKRDAAPPWAEFAKPWKWVQHKKAERRLDGFLR